MNGFENWFCASWFWRCATRRRLLPWILSGSQLGDHALELGAGPGAATDELRQLAGRVTSLEYDRAFATRLSVRMRGSNVQVLQGDAATLPFPDATFSSAMAILVLHHLKSSELQDRAFAEIHRVLRPGGVFFAFEIQDGWMQRTAHTRSTFVAVAPGSSNARLHKVGFSRVTVDLRRGGFRIRALRPREG
jgi:ubiquinone/menaquinone biosynthesis C-methylase UbiE